MSLAPTQGSSISQASLEAVEALSALSDRDHGEPSDEHRRGTILKNSDEVERLGVWITEHDVSTGRLDHKLREASHLRGRVLSLLAELSSLGAQQPATSSSKVTNIGHEGDDNVGGPLSTEARHEVFQPPPVMVKDDTSVKSSSLSIDSTMTLPDSLPDSPLLRIHDIVTLLFELGPSLIDPAPHDRFEKSTHSDAAQHDINHVRARFPRAADVLVNRLGRANWERRHTLRQLRSTHEDELSQVRQLDAIEPQPETAELFLSESATATEDSETSASDSEHSLDTASYDNREDDYERDISLSASQILTDMTSTGSDFQFSHNDTQSTAATEPSKAPKQSTQVEGSVTTRYKVPLPPKPNERLTGEAFLCPFCFHTVSDMTSPSLWRKHVFEDMEPYICTYTDCMSSAQTYGSRKSWWEHETQRHRVQRSWKCTPCEKATRKSVFMTAATFDEHFVNHHPVKLTTMQLHSIRDLCERDDGVSKPDSTCPLCKETISSGRKTGAKGFARLVKKHVSEHLEQLAFFVAVPAGQMLLMEDDSEFQDDSDSEDGLQSEIQSVVSKDTHMSKRDIHIANVNQFLADQQKADFQTAGGARVEDSEKRPPSVPGAPTAAPEFPIRILMHPPNEHFYSRQSSLTDAAKVLRSPGAICLFQGVGGVGKTLAAVEYIYTQSQQYDAIFWLQADTAPGLADSYLRMVMALGIVSGWTEDHHHVIDKGRNWLQETEKRWLLVFDNALKWLDVSRYMPNDLRRTNGSVLITTQIEAFIAPASNVHKIRLHTVNQQAGAEMLLRYLGRDVRTDSEKHLAIEVSAFVGGLPVAIAQVAGFVSYSQVSLGELIETFRQWRKRTGVATDEADDLPGSFREASFSYDGTLAMVWEVTLRELSQDARDVLNILAYLNCAAVPQNLLFGMHEDPSLHFLDIREELRLRRINESLKKRRLVETKEVDGESCFSIHRSLQRGIREKLAQDKAKQQTVFDQAVALVREVFPRSNPLQQPMPEQWSKCQRLLPHLHALHDVYHQFRRHIKGSLEFAQLLLDAGMDQFERGITQEGLLLLHTAEVVLDASSPEEQQVMKADIHAMIAIMYDNTGIEHRKESLTRRKQALDIRKKIFEAADAPRRQDEILLYNSWMEYAISLLHYHRHAEAEPIIDKCLAKFREWGPEDEIPFEYAKYYNKIALVRMYQGQFEEAIDLAAHSVQLMEKTGYRLFASRFKFDMACIILQSGDLDQALQLHKDILDQRIEIVGQTNELSLHSSYAIGAIYEMKQDFEEAETWFRKLLNQRRSITSWPDEAFSRAQFHLAAVLLARGKPEDIEFANNLREKALRALHRLFPLDRPPELDGVTDEAVLFDHMLPISPGGPRFTGRGLLPYFIRKT